MDARDRLRRYLEQRRDLGETELVLDGLSVDDVLRLVGAAHVPPRVTSDRVRALPDDEPSAPARGPVAPGVAEGDWRAALGSPQPPGPEAPPSSPPERRPDARMSLPTPAAVPSVAAVDAIIDGPPGLIVGTTERAHVGGPLDDAASLDAIAELVRACAACGLVKGAKHAVPGEGNPQAGLVLVGEAPGQSEDETGRPFVGAAGQLLTKILGAIDLRREDVYICNVIKHRPPNNRNPLPDEIAACSPFLRRQIELLRPKVIVALGTFAAQTLLETRTPIGKLRGQVHRYYGVPLVATYHPAALLRNPSWKRPTWEDVQLARRILDRASGA